MPTIELIYDSDCPNAAAARANLRAALTAADLSPVWTEWERADPTGPAHVRRYGSPTILIDGRDVAGQAPTDGAASCRIYTSAGGRLGGVPPLEVIAAGLAARANDRFRLRGMLAVLPGFGASLLPVGVCPACWPAYAGILGSLGLSPLLKTAYLLPVTGGFFGLALFGLAYRASARHGYGPLGLGLLGAVAAMVGKFVFAENGVLYLGLGLLLTASVWNSWPRHRTTPGPCASCAPQDLETG